MLMDEKWRIGWTVGSVVLILGVNIWLGPNWIYFWLCVLFNVIIWLTYINKFSVSQKGIELETKMQEVRAATDKLNVTIDQFQQTIQPMIEFNLASLAKEGQFDARTRSKYVKPFVAATSELKQSLNMSGEDLDELMGIAKKQLIESYVYDLDYFSDSQANEFIRLPDINFTKLKELSKSLNSPDFDQALQGLKEYTNMDKF